MSNESTSPVWRHAIDQRSGYLFNLSDSISIVEARFPGILTPVNTGRMVVASDYSGQHKQATHEAYSFLITTSQELETWLPLLAEFRGKFLPDGRRLSFKQLNEPVRWRSLPAFLKIAGRLRANIITILVDRRVGSFMSGGSDSIVDVFSDCFPPDENKRTAEKMFRLGSLLALVLAGLRREDQPSLWVSDHDETLDSHDRREGFARLATYLTFALTHWKRPADHLFGTTELEMVPYWAEDVAAIADLVAGSYCQLSRVLPTFFGTPTWQVTINSQLAEDQRAAAIANWLAIDNSMLKNLLVRLEDDGQGSVRASAQAFRGIAPR